MNDDQKVDEPEMEKDILKIKTEKEIEKLQIEIEKARNENKELEKKWWQKPPYISAFAPMIVGLLTLIIAWKTGFLQAQSKLNEAQKLAFDNTRKANEIYIDSLKSIITFDSLKQVAQLHSVDSLKSLKLIAQSKLDSFLNDKRNISEKVLSLIKQNAILQNDNRYLTDSFKLYYIPKNSLFSEQNNRISKLQDSIQMLQTTVIGLTNTKADVIYNMNRLKFELTGDYNRILEAKKIELNACISTNKSLMEENRKLKEKNQ